MIAFAVLLCGESVGGSLQEGVWMRERVPVRYFMMDIEQNKDKDGYPESGVWCLLLVGFCKSIILRVGYYLNFLL